jgi:YVTN family beta-propeller protein
MGRFLTGWFVILLAVLAAYGQIAPVGTFMVPHSPLSTTPKIEAAEPILHGGSGIYRTAAISQLASLSQAALPQARDDQGALNQNSTPETATVLRTIETGLRPYACLMDPRNGYAYITNGGTGNVTVLNGSTLVATVRVGGYPFQCGLDSSTGWVYVLDADGKSVSVLNGTTLRANITVGSEPEAVAYDPLNGFMYVTNLNSSSVSILSGSTLISTVPTGLYPWGVTFDAANGFIYVANAGSSSITVLNGTRVAFNITGLAGQPFFLSYDPVNEFVYAAIENIYPGLVAVINGSMDIANVPVGRNPWAPTIDLKNGWAYVPCDANNNVSVINGTRLLLAIGVGVSPYTAAYDGGNGYIYVPNYGPSPWTSPSTVSVISGTGVIATITVGAAPNSALYDSINGWMYVANGGNGVGTTVSAISTLLVEGPLSITPAGSPSGVFEAGQRIVFGSTLWAVGAGSDHAAFSSLPSTGLGCASTVNFVLGDQAGSSSIACVPTAAGNYSATIMVTDSTGKTVKSTLYLSVYPGPAVAIHFPRLSYDVGQNLTLTATGSLGSEGYTFQWSGLPSGCPILGPATACILRSVGSYSVAAVVKDSNGGTGTSSLANLTVGLAPSLSAPSFQGKPLAENPLTFTAIYLNGFLPVSLAWSFGDGSESNQSTPTHAFSKAGDYTVKVWVNDSANASVEASFSLTIANPSTNALPPPTFLGLPSTERYAVLGGIILVVVLGITVMAVRFRRGRSPPSPTRLGVHR